MSSFHLFSLANCVEGDPTYRHGVVRQQANILKEPHLCAEEPGKEVQEARQHGRNSKEEKAEKEILCFWI